MKKRRYAKQRYELRDKHIEQMETDSQSTEAVLLIIDILTINQHATVGAEPPCTEISR